MAKKNKKKRKPSGHKPPPIDDRKAHLDEVDRLASMLTDESPGAEWGKVQMSLLKAKAEASHVANIIMNRDRAGLEALRLHLHDPSVPFTTQEPIQELPEIPAETLRDAMRAFRKRMKLTKLDHESQLGRSPLTGGKEAEFESILPPHQFPSEVWKTLAANGELESCGGGFYKLPIERKEF